MTGILKLLRNNILSQNIFIISTGTKPNILEVIHSKELLRLYKLKLLISNQNLGQEITPSTKQKLNSVKTQSKSNEYNNFRGNYFIRDLTDVLV